MPSDQTSGEDEVPVTFTLNEINLIDLAVEDAVIWFQIAPSSVENAADAIATGDGVRAKIAAALAPKEVRDA